MLTVIFERHWVFNDGGLLVSLSPLLPQERLIGMDIRVKVTEYVKQRIDALRAQTPGSYGNT